MKTAQLRMTDVGETAVGRPTDIGRQNPRDGA
jgi:hypothetical protein